MIKEIEIQGRKNYPGHAKVIGDISKLLKRLNGRMNRHQRWEGLRILKKSAMGSRMEPGLAGVNSLAHVGQRSQIYCLLKMSSHKVIIHFHAFSKSFSQELSTIFRHGLLKKKISPVWLIHRSLSLRGSPQRACFSCRPNRTRRHKPTGHRG